MSRRRRGKKRKQLLTRLEQDIAILHNHRFEQPELEEIRGSLCRQFITKDYLTQNQKNAVYKLAKPIRTRSKKIRAARHAMAHWVYAISDGLHVKVGYAIDPQKRMRDMQTSNAKKLTLEAKTKCPTRSSAKRLERQIHRAGKRYHVRGEWFTTEIIRFFDEGREADERLDMEHLAEIKVYG